MIDAPEFRATLRAPALLKLFDYWQSLRRGRLMPAWSDIRPEEMPTVLPHIFVWNVTEAGDCRMRLVGESVYQAMIRTIRGKTPEDLYPPVPAAEIRDRVLRVARTPAGSGTIGTVLHDGVPIGTGERLALPYGDGQGNLGVIGASVLIPRTDPTTGERVPVNPRAFFVLTGTETWLRLHDS